LYLTYSVEKDHSGRRAKEEARKQEATDFEEDLGDEGRRPSRAAV
jgi:hypothetical protein